MLNNHVTLNGKTLSYNNNQVMINNVVVYTGVVTMAVLTTLAQ